MPAVAEQIEIRPQPGFQERFLRSSADVVIGGGAAGAGKSFALLLEPFYHQHRPGYTAVIFRKTYPEIRAPGALWDQSMELYPQTGATPIESRLTWTWPSGARVTFAHMESDKHRFAYQGSQLALIGWDEVTHQSPATWWYLFSRARSTCGAKPCIRATCNPDPDSFVADLIDWYIGEDGYPIPERAGVTRWFYRAGDDRLEWGDTRQDLAARFPDADPRIDFKTFVFIPGHVLENQLLLDANPEYLSNLKALPLVERERLLGGNWKIRHKAGSMFRREWFEIVDAAPAEGAVCRYWDRASIGEATPANPDPDYWLGVKLMRTPDGMYYVLDAAHFRATPHQGRKQMRNVASGEPRIPIVLEQDPAQAGKAEVEDCIRALDGYEVRSIKKRSDKITHASPVSAQAEAGNVKLVRGKWNDEFLTELEGFPDAAHDDAVDGLSGAYHWLVEMATVWGV